MLKLLKASRSAARVSPETTPPPGYRAGTLPDSEALYALAGLTRAAEREARRLQVAADLEACSAMVEAIKASLGRIHAHLETLTPASIQGEVSAASPLLQGPRTSGRGPRFN